MCPSGFHVGINYLSWIGWLRWTWHDHYGVWLSLSSAKSLVMYFICGAYQ